MSRDPEGLAEGEQPDGHDDDVDAVGELRDAEGEALLTGRLVDADQADHETEQQGAEAAHP